MRPRIPIRVPTFTALVWGVLLLCLGPAARAGEPSPAASPVVEAWPEGIPRPEGAVEIEIERAADGELVCSFHAGGELTPRWNVWMAAFSAAGWEMIDSVEEEGGGMRGATVQQKGGARKRAYVLLGPVRERLHGLVRTVTPPDTPVPLPGECVPIPRTSFDIYVHVHPDREHDPELSDEVRSLRFGFRTERRFDLDGDGILDALVPVADRAYCPWDVRRQLYVVRGGCGHLVGEIEGQWVTTRLHVIGGARRGLKPIETKTETSDGYDPTEPNHTTTEWRYHFDGRRYRVYDRDERRSVCHHCAGKTCTGVIPRK